MEPRDLRESPAGCGGPEVGHWREVPGEDIEVREGEFPDKTNTSRESVDMDTCKGLEREEKRMSKKGEQYRQEDELDPRIHEELEQLNEASAEINKFELQLDDARSGYRRILTDSARKLNAHSLQLGTCIEKARPYYEARRLAKEAQQETQKAALSYERAVSMHTAAREMVYVAEQGLLADGRNTLDPTWQEMLNHATSKVNEAEEERLRSEREHMRVTHACQEAEARVQTLQKALKRVIVKSKPYFELKAQFNNILEEHKTKVMQLEEKVSKVKSCYSIALRNLEKISEQIHAQRLQDQVEGGPTTTFGGRSSPVGAESDNVMGAEGVAFRVAENERVDGSKMADEKNKQEVKYIERAETECGRETERAGSDSLSVFSLQTIASDLEKCDSVEHLGDFSDVGSVTGEDGEKDGTGGKDKRNRITEITTKERQQQFLQQHHRSFSL